MAFAYWDRLSAVDAAFLAVEDAAAHMHIGSISLFDAEPLCRPEGGLDLERILGFIGAQLHKVPRLRQKLRFAPVLGQPGWVDDGSFNLLYHVRHSALPAPGDVRQLKRLAGRILSQQLDRGKPLWELWLVEGVEGGRFALITKLHHCLADGISGRDALTFLIGNDPDYAPAPAPRWIPRPAPGARRLLADEVRRLLAAPFRLAGTTDARSEAWKRGASPGQALRALVDAARGASFEPTPLNVEIGPHRRIDWTEMDLGDVRELAGRAGGKVNDVVLAVVAGALRGFLKQRGVRLDTLAFQAALPVSVRSASERGALGNRVSGMLATLPLDEADPWRRLLRVVDTTHELKGSGQVAGAELVERALELVPFRLAAPLERWGARRPMGHMVVTNVPGPQVPVYLLGARMRASYPVVPLTHQQALGVALYSCDGRLCWGLNSDWDALPDLHDFAERVLLEFETLRKVAAAPPRAAALSGNSR
jgi:diacylglycerol O-acyltransferase / wax synthase